MEPGLSRPGSFLIPHPLIRVSTFLSRVSPGPGFIPCPLSAEVATGWLRWVNASCRQGLVHYFECLERPFATVSVSPF
jgi:hypothetical protein